VLSRLALAMDQGKQALHESNGSLQLRSAPLLPAALDIRRSDVRMCATLPRDSGESVAAVNSEQERSLSIEVSLLIALPRPMPPTDCRRGCDTGDIPDIPTPCACNNRTHVQQPNNGGG
jgi:hypothetical protein